MRMVFCGHWRTQRPQAMQPALQTLRTCGPRSRFRQETTVAWETGTRARIPFGHSCVQRPHPVHFSRSTTGRPAASSMKRASNGHARTQVPSPTQP
ncbi:MAG: hypothetical protein A6D92_25590 [Symbiobacterium thermophilum]|uniref:Uncharacterized protein n=1 Tax=Symbiobacterium thermophilum TaxID=2734 RepID=A0A1Y2T2N7_SYMTR|nr:MAG: hypothetical protein A6D92_25590 [Symbiobacterium thermophilum]